MSRIGAILGCNECLLVHKGIWILHSRGTAVRGTQLIACVKIARIGWHSMKFHLEVKYDQYLRLLTLKFITGDYIYKKVKHIVF